MALLGLIAAMGSGCSGVNYSHGVSPIDFLLPGGFMRGLMKNETQPTKPDSSGPEIFVKKQV